MSPAKLTPIEVAIALSHRERGRQLVESKSSACSSLKTMRSSTKGCRMGINSENATLTLHTCQRQLEQNTNRFAEDWVGPRRGVQA